MSKDHTIDQIRQMYMDACAMAEGTDADEIGTTTFKTHDERFLWKKSWFEETIELPFEDTTITCPKEYDKVLTKTFGDWRTPVQDSSNHEMFILDTETSYLDRNDLC